ncbi:hypothetical protein DXG01_002388 [Tephrocybe rancida]|nr:hypothetical protein DXG01_002388 [Tephrocybe rancida]
MSKPLAVQDLIANDDETSPLKNLPYFNITTDFEEYDPLEYCMGMKRGGLRRQLTGEIHPKARLNLIEASFESFWALVPEDDILKELMVALYQKKPWGSVVYLCMLIYYARPLNSIVACTQR